MAKKPKKISKPSFCKQLFAKIEVDGRSYSKFFTFLNFFSVYKRLIGMILEERIERIICASEIELDGEAYIGKYELNNVKSIKKFILDKLRGKIKNLITGDYITLSKQSSQKLASHFKDGKEYQKSLAHIPKIIENMLFLEEMKPDKENASFDKYSYYITKVNIDGESHTILSTVGSVEQKIYYDQNVFKGTMQEVFARAKNDTSDAKYSRLKEILKKTDKGDWDPIGIINPETPTAFTNKYSKFS